MGLGDRKGHKATQLSGGEQQRVAIARALVGEPRLLLADEPTGNLDTRTGGEVMETLESLNGERGVAVVLVTHDRDIAIRTGRQIYVRDGLIERDSRRLAAHVRLAEAFRVALDALRANRLRSLLTMLGVIIGVGAVVVLVAIGSGAKQEVEAQVEGLGRTSSSCSPGRSSSGRRRRSAGWSSTTSSTSGASWATLTSVATTVSSGETVSVGSIEIFSTIAGTNENVPNVFDRPVARGEYLTATDVDTRRRVAVLGQWCRGRRSSATSSRSVGRSRSPVSGSGSSVCSRRPARPSGSAATTRSTFR